MLTISLCLALFACVLGCPGWAAFWIVVHLL